MKGNLLASAANKEELEKLINQYYFSSNYFINDENKIEHSIKHKVLDGVRVVVKSRRWRFELVDTNNQ